MQIEQQITDLKNSVTVEGKLLLSKNWTDEQIASQINLLMNQNTYSSRDLVIFIDKLLKNIPDNLSTSKQIEEYITDELYKKVNWTEKFMPEFWRNFGSAPFTHKNTHNEKLVKARKNGAKGMDEIFEHKFESGYSMTYELNNLVYGLPDRIAEHELLKNMKTTVYTSPYSSFEEIEDTLPKKKAKIEGMIFYKDKTKPMEERIKAFEEYGDVDEYIHSPMHSSLNDIFDVYSECGESERRDKICCLDIVEWWMEEIISNRLEIDYKTNQYHPKLVKLNRGYVPSNKAIERLRDRYAELLFMEDVSGFTFDW